MQDLNTFKKYWVVNTEDRGRDSKGQLLKSGDLVEVFKEDEVRLYYANGSLQRKNVREWQDVLNKDVRVLANDVGATHPTEDRGLRPGEVVRIINVTGSLVEYKYGKDGVQCLRAWDVELVSDNKSDCSCKSLLNGHEFGCHFYKEL